MVLHVIMMVSCCRSFSARIGSFSPSRLHHAKAGKRHVFRDGWGVEHPRRLLLSTRDVPEKSNTEPRPVSYVRCSSEAEHLDEQLRVFGSDAVVDWFSSRDEEVTPQLEPLYRDMCETILASILDGRVPATATDDVDDARESVNNPVLRILDVACGTGVLWEFLIDEANKRNLRLHITGVDLSLPMVESGRERAKELLKASDGGSHMIDVVRGDIVEYCRQHSKSDPASGIPYDGAILNACFGNFWDPRHVLQSIAPLATTVSISHPLGAKFVQELHRKSPTTVPHVLPETPYEILEWTQGLPFLILSSKKTKSSSSESSSSYNSDYYLTTLRATRARSLPDILRYRGVVDQGYGRGGKKLGVPTANLPASLFQNALESVTPGVYIGWAALEGRSNEIFKAVVNVGYSPTFEGQENREKIIEAHLLVGDGHPIPDFYGVPMRLQLAGFLREERKFDGFPALIAQIQADILEAKSSLDCMPYVSCRGDRFLVVGDSDNLSSRAGVTSSDAWEESYGGDEVASWEVAPFMPFLKNTL